MALEDADFEAHRLPWNYYSLVSKHISKALQNVRIAYAALISAQEEEQKPPKLFS